MARGEGERARQNGVLAVLMHDAMAWAEWMVKGVEVRKRKRRMWRMWMWRRRRRKGGVLGSPGRRVCRGTEGARQCWGWGSEGRLENKGGGDGRRGGNGNRRGGFMTYRSDHVRQRTLGRA